MKPLLIGFALICVALSGLGQQAGQPAFYINNVRSDSETLRFLDPNAIDSVTVVKKEPTGAVYIRLKTGHTLVPLISFVRDTLRLPKPPFLYIIDDHLIHQPDSIRLDKTGVRAIELSDASATADGSLMVVLITTSVPKPQPRKPGEIILR